MNPKSQSSKKRPLCKLIRINLSIVEKLKAENERFAILLASFDLDDDRDDFGLSA